MKIRQKIILAFVLAALSVGVIGVFSVSAIQRIIDHYGTGNNGFRSVIQSSTEVMSYGKRAEGHLILFLATGAQENREKFFQRHEALRGQIEVLDGQIKNQKSRQLLNEIKVAADELLLVGNLATKTYDEDIAKTGNFDLKSRGELVIRLNETGSALRAKGAELSLLEADLENQVFINSATNARIIQRTILSAAVFVFLFAVVFGYFVSKSINTPIALLEAATIEIGKGNLDAIAQIRSKDEIGDLARSFNKMVGDLKKSRADLAAAKIFTDKVLESMVDFVVVTDMDLTITKVNQAALKINGYEEHELIGKSPNMLMADRPFTEKGLELLRQNGYLADLDKINLNKDGTLTPISMSLSVFKDEEGNDLGVVCVGKDISERKRAEKELYESQQLLKLVIDTLPMGIWWKDRASVYLGANRYIADVAGLESPEKMIGLTDYDIPSIKENAESFRESDRLVMESGVPELNIVQSVAQADGRISWHNTNKVPLRNADGEIVGVIGTFADITEQRGAEEAIRRSEGKYRNILETIEEGYFETDEGGRFTFLNDAFCELLGYGREELIGFNCKHFVDKENKRKIFRIFKDIYKSGQPGLALNWEIIRKDGERKAQESSVSPMKNASGEVVGFRGVVRDITERRRDEERLRNSEMNLAEAQQIARIGSFQLDISTGKVKWSDELWRIFGLEPREFGLSYKEYVKTTHPDDREFVIKTLEKVNREKKITNFHHRIVRPDGTVRVISNRGKFIFDEDGKLIKINGVHQDITEQVEMAEQLQRAHDAALESVRLKSEFLANMSHEIRTPMNGVIGMTGLLLDTPLNAAQRDYAETIQTSADGLLRIIDDILDFSKIEAGQMRFEQIDFDLNDAVESAVEMLAERARVKGIELASLVYKDVPTALRSDAGRLRQILTNLIGNAIKFTETGEVTVSVKNENETEKYVSLRFEVADTGIGISQEARKKLFQAFVQADGSTTRKYGGTGLGLAISKQIVEMMDGDIGIESEPGKGSTFWFTARFEKQASGKPPVQTSGEISLEGLRVLIVDDSATNRRIFTHQTASWGMKATEADSGAGALEILREAAEKQEFFDVAIMDLMMPGMDGFELAQMIKSDPSISKTHLLLLPSYGKRGHGKMAKDFGIAAYLQKPVRQSQLYNCLIKIVAEASANGSGDCHSPELITRHSLRAKTLQAKDSTDDALSKVRILVTEDNAINRKVAIRQLQKLGYAADVAVNGREAVEILGTNQYDIVLMDCQMPEMDGFEATAEIRRREADANHTVIVAMTAHALKGEREKCLAAGMDDYLSKPVKLESLRQTIERWSDPLAAETIIDNENDLNIVSALQNLESIDSSVLESFRDLQPPDEPDIVTELIDLFLEDVSRRLPIFKKAVAEQDFSVIKEQAHSLKGGSGNIGARRITEISKMIEEQDADASRMRSLIEQLENEFETTAGILREMRVLN